MTFKDQFQFVRKNMKKNKVRIFMTVLATAMGCAFLIVLASVGFGLHQSIIKDTMEQRAVTEINIHGVEEDDGGYRSINDSDIEFIESIDGVNVVTRRKDLYQSPVITIDNYEAFAQTFVAHFPSEVKAGLELSEGRLPEAEDEIVIGYHFVENLFPKQEDSEEAYDEDGRLKEEYKYQEPLVGKTVDFTVKQFVDDEEKTHTIPLKIVGITEKPTRDWAMDQTVFISEETLTEIEEFTGTSRGMINHPSDGGGRGVEPEVEENTYDMVYAYADNLETVKEITEELDANNYASWSAASELKEINIIFTIAKAGLIFIGTIAILIASIGIYNTMTMAVTERAPDIGIMKAIGANPKTIKRIFLLESSYIGLIGAVIGTVVAYIISFAVNIGIPLIIEMAFDEQLPEGLKFSAIPWTLVAISISICLFVTILSGLRPAKRATQIDVLKAMRREI